MATYRLTALRDMCSGKLKKGTTCTITYSGTRKPQFTDIKKSLGLNTSSSPVVNYQNFIIEEIG